MTVRLDFHFHYRRLFSPSLPLSLSLSKGIDNTQITPSFLATFWKILTLSREHPTSCRLGLQQCLDIASFFSQHYMTKRVVARETLYSLVSSDYIPGLSHTLFLVCVTLARKWEESVSMGTATHQDGTHIVHSFTFTFSCRRYLKNFFLNPSKILHVFLLFFDSHRWVVEVYGGCVWSVDQFHSTVVRLYCGSGSQSGTRDWEFGNLRGVLCGVHSDRAHLPERCI